MFNKKEEEKIAKPKFEVGQIVFVLRNNIIDEKRIEGILALYNENSRWNNKPENIRFQSYVYFFDKVKSVDSYSWIEENKVFLTKEELLKSL